MLADIWTLAQAHDLRVFSVAISVNLLSSYLLAVFLEDMRPLSIRRKLAMLSIVGAMAGFSVWSVWHLLLAAYVPYMPASFDGQAVAIQIAVSVCYSTTGSLASQSARRWHHQVALFLVPIFPVLANFWAIGNMAGQQAADWDVLVSASPWILLVGVAMAMTAPRDPAVHVAPAVPFAALHTLGMLIIHLAMLRAYGLNLDAYPPISEVPGAVSIGPFMFPVFVANVLLISVAAASHFADNVATQEAVAHYRKLALEDRLTGLPNRAGMNAALKRRLDDQKDGRDGFAVALIDLDHFKEVNDLHGHGAGDELLTSLSRHLQARLAPDERLFRLGGDEFVAIKLRLPDREAAQAFGASLCRMVNDFDDPVSGDVKIGASVGVAAYPDDGTTATGLLSRADLAMYAAKRSGRNHCLGFRPEMEQETRLRTALSADMNGAIPRGEMYLAYQPQVDSLSGEVVGFEALMRWNHPRRGLVPPGTFIPIAEEGGHIAAIGEWALREACLEAARWARALRVAVNVAPAQLARADFAQIVQSALLESGLDPGRLDLEITESGFKRDGARARATLDACRALGVGVSMDDFGTGYSSLSTLLQCRFDRLKIDISFIRRVTEDLKSAEIVRAMIALAATNGMAVVAEGVETEEQRAFLVGEGCDELQGFLFDSAQPADVIRSRFALLAETTESRSASGAA